MRNRQFPAFATFHFIAFLGIYGREHKKRYFNNEVFQMVGLVERSETRRLSVFADIRYLNALNAVITLDLSGFAQLYPTCRLDAADSRLGRAK